MIFVPDSFQTVQPTIARWDAVNSTITFRKQIHKEESYAVNYILFGKLFSKQLLDIDSNVTVSILHSFRDQIVKHAKEMFPFNPKDNKSIVTSAIGAVWHQEQLFVVVRLWLIPGFISGSKNNDAFQTSYLYFQKYDASLKPISEGEIIGIPAPKTTHPYGPEDPRIVRVGKTILVMISMVTGKGVNGYRIEFFIWDLMNKRLFKPTIQNFNLNKSEKNWCPLVINDTLHMIYSFVPMQVVKCDNKAACQFIFRQNASNFKASTIYLRGGTPFERYKDAYYLAVAHASVFKNGRKIITAHFVLLNVDHWRIVYVSEAIRMNFNVLSNTWHPPWMLKTFLYPTGLIIESEDVVNIACNINDTGSYFIKVKGLRRTLNKVIALDSGVRADSVKAAAIQEYLLNHMEPDKISSPK